MLLAIYLKYMSIDTEEIIKRNPDIIIRLRHIQWWIWF